MGNHSTRPNEKTLPVSSHRQAFSPKSPRPLSHTHPPTHHRNTRLRCLLRHRTLFPSSTYPNVRGLVKALYTVNIGQNDRSAGYGSCVDLCIIVSGGIQCTVKMSLGSLKNILAGATIQGVTEARARIFGHVLNPTGQRSPHKILRKKLIGEKVAQWYPYDIKKDDPLIMAQQEQERLSKLEMLKRRGKGPPKKGHGKGAAKRNRQKSSN